MTSTRPALRALADAVGIAGGYWEQTGRQYRETSDETRAALLAAMGWDASSEASAARALEAMRAAERARLLPPVRVVEAGDAALRRVTVRLAEPTARPIRWTLELRQETGGTLEASGELPRGGGWELALELPAAPPPGYHTVRVALHGAGGPASVTAAEQSLIVVPPSCTRVEEVLGADGQAVGLIANLYTVRSERNWGAGDFTDLGALLAWAGEVGCDFVGVNPLHALRDKGIDVSPYSPVSRLFRNPLYLDVERIPELAHSPEAQRIVADAGFRRELDDLRAARRLDYAAVMAHKLPVLRALHHTFRERGDAGRRATYERWTAERDPALTDFATFMALSDVVGMTAPWPEWPPELRSPRTPAVQDFRRSNAEAVDFHRWLQWQLDEQLGAAAARADEADLRIGLYQDLAIGTSPTGSDAWSFQHLFVRGVNVGAPPDPYSATGQDWGLPPLDPRALVEDRYRYWITLLRSAFLHAGALRLDHVMGLFRLFWIPQGKSGEHGAYVRYPAADLLGILALESVRHRALVVGEDLGTVPEDVPPALAKWGVLHSKVLYFERGDRGSFRAADEYAARALATANTHDMPTIESWWGGRDLALRREVGIIDDEGAAREREERARDREQLLRRLREDGALPRGGDEPSAAELRAAVHAFLRRTPAALVGLSLDDVAGEVEPVNVPGVAPDKYPSWQRRMGRTIEELRSAVGPAELGARSEERGATAEHAHHG